MKTYTRVSTRQTPQSQPIAGKNMVQNNAGGFTFAIDKWGMLDRFLILGSEGGTYYVSENTLTLKNAQNVLECIKEDGLRVVKTILDISHSGRAPKNDPALFALAMVVGNGNEVARKAAFEALPNIARIGTHLFHFAQYVEQFRGWGRGLRNAIGNWYSEKTALDLANQITKYAQRDGWSHRDLLRLSHPKASTKELNSIFGYIVKGPEAITRATTEAQKYLRAVDEIKTVTDAKKAAQLIADFELPREVVPTELLNEKVVWDALLQKMPMTAMIRNLATMTRVGIIDSKWIGEIQSRLANVEILRKARIHPINVLQALVTYSSGHGMRGDNTWNPVQQIVDALDEAFYLAFTLVEPTKKRFVLGVDVSGSMGIGQVSGIYGMTPRIAAAAMSMLTARTEKNYHIMGFSTEFIPLAISPRRRLDDIAEYMGRLPFSGTDCALPMTWALKNKIEADCFIVYTDNETWAGTIHPMQALRKYRDGMGIPAKLIVSAFTGTQFSIADPSDAGSLDIVGFDSSVPTIISDFVTR